ncbi:MAG: hypothetical protein ACSLFJ_14410 [Immundisolibacter sp.]
MKAKPVVLREHANRDINEAMRTGGIQVGAAVAARLREMQPAGA